MLRRLGLVSAVVVVLVRLRLLRLGMVVVVPVEACEDWVGAGEEADFAAGERLVRKANCAEEEPRQRV